MCEHGDEGATMNGQTILRQRCRFQSDRSDPAIWWQQPWVSPGKAALVGRGIATAAVAGAVSGASVALALAVVSSFVTAIGFVLVAVIGAGVGAYVGAFAGVVVAPILALVLDAIVGSRRRALRSG